MKKIIAVFLAICVTLLTPVSAQWSGILGASRTAGTTYTARDANTGSDAGNTVTTQFNDAVASNFPATASYTISKVDVTIWRTGTGGAGNVTVRLYASAASLPTGPVLWESAAQANSSLPTSKSVVSFTGFTGTSGAITNTVSYCIVVWMTSGKSNDGSNKVNVEYASPAGLNYLSETDNGGSTWSTNAITNAQGIFTTYSSP